MTELILIVALVLANGLFAAAEIAVLSVRRARLRELAEAGSRRARAVQNLRGNPELFLATVQICITGVSAAAAAYSGEQYVERLSAWLVASRIAADWSQWLAFGVVVAVISFVSLVFGELVPKSLALRSAETLSIAMGPWLLVLSKFLRPASWLLTKTSNLVLGLVQDKTNFAEARLSGEELRILLEEASSAGAVEATSGRIAGRALELAELTAKSVVVPRKRIDALDIDGDLDTAVAAALATQHTRLVAYRGTLDQPVGYVRTRDILVARLKAQPPALKALVRPLVVAPWKMPAPELLEKLLNDHCPMAAVVDEHGGLVGLVTLEDLLEELVGEIHEDDGGESWLIDSCPDGGLILYGNAPVRDVNRDYGRDLPESQQWSTVAGLVIARSGRIPEVGDRIEIAEDACEFEVIKQTAGQIVELRLWPVEPAEPREPAP
ncbi:MAG: HlyC/CorC family transporter [Deltaproteobacteria bacterium]|nr:HlyC/CorC family transporter [Deltaproteobacteria bacterium]